MSLLWRGTYFTLGCGRQNNALFFTFFFFLKGKHWEKRLFRHYFVACFGQVFLASSISNQFVYDYENKHEKTAQVWKMLN